LFLGGIQMKSRKLEWVFRAVLILGLLVIPSFSISAAPPDDSPAAAAAAGANVPSGVPTTLNLINIFALPGTAPIPIVDGACGVQEYSSGSGYSFFDGPAGGQATVNLVHDSTYLYVCVVAQPGTLASRFASLYLDPQGDGSTYTFARQDDYSLRVNIPGASGSGTAYRGSGVANGYVSDPSIDATWWAQQASDNQGKNDTAEFRVSLKKFGINVCNTIFGLATYHHWFSAVGDDYGWPSSQWFDQPHTWQLARLVGEVNGPECSGKSGKIAYVFRGNTLDATNFYSLLTGAGYSVTLIPLADVLLYDFTTFDLTIIADDSGSLDQWSTPADRAAQIAKITAVGGAHPNGTPILGIGEGGYAFFGRLSLFNGWPRGWHGPMQTVSRDPGDTTNIFTAGPIASPIQHYTAPTNSVGIYLKPAPLPGDVVSVALEEPLDDHANIILQGCRMLWGSGGNPSGMTGDGTNLFLNTVAYTRNFQCAPPPPPPSDTCYTLTKTANPPVTSVVPVGGVIEYTLHYQLKPAPVGTSCPTIGKLVDMIPFGTAFIPGSASDGIAPAGGVLTWSVGTSTGELTKVFRVNVTENVCAANKKVANFAELRPSGAAPLASATLVHDIACQPLGLPTDQPMYAESEFRIEPYPLVAGRSTFLSVRVQNLTASPQPVTVQFQSSPAVFGIGLDYSTALGSASAIVPASGYADVGIHFAPTLSGIACIQAVVTAANGSAPMITQSCLDVVEVLHPGQPATLTFPVRNNTGAAGTVSLVVDNTCPGWTAAITTPGSGQYVNLAAGATGSPQAVLTVTPGLGVTLGSGCHIDVQAWIGDKMIGGIRKIDIAPVHLPLHVTPPWEEPEISFIPDPPVQGVPGQLCIQLVNPLPTNQSVTVDFSVADFGAGVGFTPAASAVFNLPPNSIGTYCTAWTPLASGTLHRCVLATLKQTGYRDQTSQRNIDIVRPSSGLSGLTIPFVVGNPDLVGHILTFERRLVGINPVWMPIIEPLGGGVLPATIPGGGQLSLQLRFAPSGLALAPNLAPPLLDLSAGSRQSVEVSVLLDGVPTSGFTVQLDPYKFYLPATRK
jgi:hypothetical protein